MLPRDGHAVLLVDHASRPAVAALVDTLVTIKPTREAASVAFTVEAAIRHGLSAADRAFAVRLDPALRAVADAASAGGTVRDIAAALGLSTATAWRRLGRARALGLVRDDEGGETSETTVPGAAPAPLAATAPAGSVVPRETGETAGPPAGLAQVSTAVLRRTLTRRLQARQRGRAEEKPRPGPAILAGIADAPLVAECTRRLRPPHAARLVQEFAPLQSAL
jgi:transposase-like protein